jgi:hypothetical protein
MNCNVEGNGIRDAASASNLVSQVQFNGLVRHLACRTAQIYLSKMPFRPSVDFGCSKPERISAGKSLQRGQELLLLLLLVAVYGACASIMVDPKAPSQHVPKDSVLMGDVQTPLGTSLNAKVIQPFLASAVQSRSLQKPILVRLPDLTPSDTLSER